MNADVLEKLLDIGREMAENRNLKPLLEYAMNVALDLVDAEYGYLVMVNKEGRLDFRVKHDRDGNELDEPEEQISHTILEKVIDDRRSLITADAIVDPDFQFAESVMSLKLRSVMCSPLISRGEVLGAIYVENRSERDIFEEVDLKPLEYFAAQAAVSIENAMLNEGLEVRVAARTADLVQANKFLKDEIEERKRVEAELQKLATTDPLINVFNRRHFFSIGEQELERAQRYGRSFSIVLFDIDFFKEINDKYGHIAGDRVLQVVADRVLENLRKVDLFARYGGDEFIILMPETNLESAKQTSERLHQKVTSQMIDTERGSNSLGLSMGVATLDQNDDLEKLVSKADQALYSAKNAGRNRVVSWQE